MCCSIRRSKENVFTHNSTVSTPCKMPDKMPQVPSDRFMCEEIVFLCLPLTLPDTHLNEKAIALALKCTCSRR